MQDLNYFIGICFAINAGLLATFGLLLQKKVVNELPPGEKVGRNLLKKPLWIVGFICEMVLGSVFYLLAFTPPWGIGAALVPGLMAVGLIILAIGSIKILNERITKQDLIGIALMIGGITLLGFSKLETEVLESNLLDSGFILRAVIFSLVFLSISIFCQIFQSRTKDYKGIHLAIFSGSMYVISNFWVGVLMPLFGFVFGKGQFIVFFIITVVILIFSNIFGVFKMQQAFQHGRASSLIPIQQVPVQTGPIFIYFAIFMLVPPEFYSFPFMVVGVILIIVSSFLLARRQAQLEEIK
ncbi:MAG TPA: DMT family transporter [Candidatus Deferrimicrobium sp.]|nr:DMT family transporter [Candidatus Deferrimicrobium sp.]